MRRQHHYLKCETEYFQAVERGEKKFELRLNDRDYKARDIIYLNEVVNGKPTGRSIEGLVIKYIFYGGRYGLPENYCIFNW